MSEHSKQPIIIKKIKKVSAAGHHGGSWKIAYADFVTAMMAFFMLMWLINVTSEEQRKGIADFFAPNIINMKSRNGAGGMMGGINVSNPNNSNGKGTEPSPTEKPEEVITEDVTTNMMSEEVKKVTKSPEAMQRSSTSETNASEETKSSSDSNSHQDPSVKDAQASTVSTQAQTAAQVVDHSTANIANKDTATQESKIEPAPHKAQSAETKQGQEQGKSESQQKKDGSNVSKGEGTQFGQSQQQNADAGQRRPQKDNVAKSASVAKSTAMGENIASGQNIQSKENTSQGQGQANASPAGTGQPSQTTNGEKVSDSQEKLNGKNKEQGQKNQNANEKAMASPNGQRNPAVEKNRTKISLGQQTASGRDVVYGKHAKQAEMQGQMKPTYRDPGSALAKGHESALVKLQSQSQTQSRQNVSNQQKQKNIQDADSKTRSTSQAAGRPGQISPEVTSPQVRHNVQNKDKDKDKEKDKEKNKNTTQTQHAQQNPDKFLSKDRQRNVRNGSTSKSVTTQAQMLQDALQREQAKMQQRQLTQQYRRSIEHGLSGRMKKELEKVKKVKKEAKTQPESAQAQAAKKALEQLQEAEEKQIKQMLSEVMATVSKNPELKGLLPQIVAEVRPEGLRIQLIDQDKMSMFPSGSYAILPKTRKLLAAIAKLVAPMTNQVVISGHTDATPYMNPKRYGNWELSADRANATRRVLIEHGVGEDRFESVMGKEATDPFNAKNPRAAENRRISITLLRQYGTPESAMYSKLTDPDATDSVLEATKATPPPKAPAAPAPESAPTAQPSLNPEVNTENASAADATPIIAEPTQEDMAASTEIAKAVEDAGQRMDELTKGNVESADGNNA